MLGDIIKKYRKENGLTQEEFASKVICTRAIIYILEKNDDGFGKEPHISLSTFENIAKAMGIKASELMRKLEDGEY